MTLTFRYKSVTRPTGTVKCPIIPITLSGISESVDMTALIDSGADVTAISQELGELLNLDLTGPQSPVKGVTGAIPSVETTVNITIGNDREHYTFLIPVIVLMGPANISVLLGRRGLFNKFIIVFDELKEKVTLKRTIQR